MKYVKILTLAAMALTAFMAMASTASATTLTSPTGTTFTGQFIATSTNATLTGFFTFAPISCPHSIIKGTITSHGTGKTVTGHIEEMTFGPNCTNGTPTTPVGAPGTLEIHASATNTGTLTSLNALVEIHNTSLGTCSFGTSATGTSIGTVTGSSSDTAKAFLTINAKLEGKGGICGSGLWHGKYEVTSPVPLHIDV